MCWSQKRVTLAECILLRSPFSRHVRLCHRGDLFRSASHPLENIQTRCLVSYPLLGANSRRVPRQRVSANPDADKLFVQFNVSPIPQWQTRLACRPIANRVSLIEKVSFSLCCRSGPPSYLLLKVCCCCCCCHCCCRSSPSTKTYWTHSELTPTGLPRCRIPCQSSSATLWHWCFSCRSSRRLLGICSVP